MIIGSAAKCRICMRQHATTTSHNKVVRSKLCCSHCKREWHPIERAYNKFPRHDDRSTHPISAPPKTNLIIYISFCLTSTAVAVAVAAHIYLYSRFGFTFNIKRPAVANSRAYTKHRHNQANHGQ